MVLLLSYKKFIIKLMDQKGFATLILTLGILAITLAIIGGSFFIRNSSTKLSSIGYSFVLDVGARL